MVEKQRREPLRVINTTPGDEGIPAIQGRESLGIELRDAALQYPVGSLRGSLKTSLLSVFGHKDRTPGPTYVDALRGLNLRISFGERVAIVGHNGSGKSTLLRTLAGIYPLSAGEVTVVGKIETLLDIGLGFEVESTGRENIYYRGMTMGYSRKQLALVEDEIVEFAGLGGFIDLPMRTYSAGMFVRLGFAVSTQFSPDILLVDEVFGAGDATFARKAFERMSRIVKHAGIFVIATHDLSVVERFCSRVIWLERGEVVRDGPPQIIIPDYLNYMSGDT